MEEDNGSESAARTTERSRRGGWGQGLTEQLTVQASPRTIGIIRIMWSNEGRSVADIIREALENDGLCAVEGYDRARREYDEGRRVPKTAAPRRKSTARGIRGASRKAA